MSEPPFGGRLFIADTSAHNRAGDQGVRDEYATPMTPDPQLNTDSSRARILARLRDRLWTAASRILLRTVPPYARHRARQARIEATLQRLDADLAHVRKRHAEQIERLEELTRELVLTAEALRREAANRTRREED